MKVSALKDFLSVQLNPYVRRAGGGGGFNLINGANVDNKP